METIITLGSIFLTLQLTVAALSILVLIIALIVLAIKYKK